MLRDCEDVKIARAVAKMSRQPHTVIRLDEGFISQFPNLAEKTVYITDGTMDVTGSADLYANRSAREIAPIRLTGNYGQEILRGAIAFRPRILDERLFDSEFIELLREAEQTYAAELVHPTISFVAFKQLPWHHYSRLAIESSQVTTRSPYIDNEVVALAYRSPLCAAATKQKSLRLISEGKFGLDKLATDRGVVYSPKLLVTRINKLYQDFTFKAEYAFDYGMPQWLARIDKVISILHPEKLFLGRHKICHFRIWYKDHLAGYLKEILFNERSLKRTYLNGSYLKKIVEKHTSGKSNFTIELHSVFTAELMHRRLIENI
jgi:asparagine synthase (glutamine-hydrolysing)